MSKTTYYYDPPGSLNVIDAPGEVCDFCGKLGRIGKAGTLVPMPSDGLHEEYGKSAGDIHGHLECAKSARDEYKRLYEESAHAIEEFEKRS